MFQRILFATDFSAHSQPALDRAIAWGARPGARLELLHVMQPAVYTMAGEVTLSTGDLEDQLFRELEEEMKRLVERVRERVPSATGHVTRGYPGQVIVEHATWSRAELVVMGTDGHGAVARAVLGSVADRVVRSSRVPVMLVPHGGRAVSGLPKAIVAPTDFSTRAHRAIVTTLELASELGADVTLVHAYEVPRFVDRDPSVKAALREAMATQVWEEHPGLRERPRVAALAREGAAAPTIVGLCEEQHADLVAMASTGRGFLSSFLLGGVTDRVVRTSHVPVLVLRTAD